MTQRLIRLIAPTLALLCAAPFALAEDSPTFRGPDRDGRFAADGLAEKWPEDGPKQLWSTTGVGEGYSSLAISGGRIFTTGEADKKGRVVAFDLSGKKLWETAYGEEHPGNGYPGSRTTPSTDGDGVFVLSSQGKAVAVDAESGEQRWQVDVLKEYGGKNIYFGVSESPLIDGDRVIYTPGGKDASLVALDKKTGKLVWKTEGLSDISAYCSIRLVEVDGKRQLVTLLSQGVVSVDPANGKVLWQHERKAQYDIHAVSPLFSGNTMVLSHGYGQGTRAYGITDGGVKELWHEQKLDVHHGGGVLVDGVFYGAASKGTWYGLNLEDGSIVHEARRLGKGTLIYADGKIYGYNEKGGVLLVDPKDLSVLGRFKITAGEGQHWSHPVISHQVLYIRHGDVLMAFDVKAAEAEAGTEKAAG